MDLSIRLRAQYDGRDFHPERPLTSVLEPGATVEITVKVDPLQAYDSVPAQKRAHRIRSLRNLIHLPKGIDREQIDAGRDHPEMYPDRW